MGLTRKQVNLLITSAEDHERMPEDEDSESQDLIGDKKDGKMGVLKRNDNDTNRALRRLRRGIKKPGRYKMFGDEVEAKEMKNFKPGNNVSHKSPVKSSSDDMNNLINMARQGGSGFKLTK